MPIIKNKTVDAPLSSAELFCNMKGGAAFRIIEMYKNIRTSLLFTLSDDKEHIIVITSAEPNSGKSVTTANLGLSFSQTGARILIVDCDMRNPSQHKIFAQDNTQGLSNVLSSMCTFEDVVKRNVYDNLDIVTAGQTPPNPSELLGSNKMRTMLETVKNDYDFVLLDSPPVELVSDTAALLLNAPQAIVIARQNHAIYPEVIHTVEVVKSVGGKILGAVLTDVSEKNKSYSYATGMYSRYGGYGRYGRYGVYSRYGRYGNYGSYGHYGSYGSHSSGHSSGHSSSRSHMSGYFSAGNNRHSNKYGKYSKYGYSKYRYGTNSAKNAETETKKSEKSEKKDKKA
ncbi:MAG: CpsD/CapB family tyrosine-protein kinase [Clostridia bacterium]|nr:CpsD/CapB family tyrosine-protein kinase [Clostridia bacterium]